MESVENTAPPSVLRSQGRAQVVCGGVEPLSEMSHTRKHRHVYVSAETDASLFKIISYINYTFVVAHYIAVV